MTVPARRFPNFPGSRLLLLLAGVGLVLPLPTVAAEPPASRPPEDWQVAAPTDVAGLQAIEGRIKDLLAKVVPCTVAVRVGSSQASGVVVTKDGHVLTAGHVVENSGLPVTFTFPDGKTCKGTTLGAHRGIDAGLMKITDSGDWPFVEMGRSEALRPGDLVPDAGASPRVPGRTSAGGSVGPRAVLPTGGDPDRLCVGVRRLRRPAV